MGLPNSESLAPPYSKGSKSVGSIDPQSIVELEFRTKQTVQGQDNEIWKFLQKLAQAALIQSDQYEVSKSNYLRDEVISRKNLIFFNTINLEKLTSSTNKSRSQILQVIKFIKSCPMNLLHQQHSVYLPALPASNPIEEAGKSISELGHPVVGEALEATQPLTELENRNENFFNSSSSKKPLSDSSEALPDQLPSDPQETPISSHNDNTKSTTRPPTDLVSGKQVDSDASECVVLMSMKDLENINNLSKHPVIIHYSLFEDLYKNLKETEKVEGYMKSLWVLQAAMSSDSIRIMNSKDGVLEINKTEYPEFFGFLSDLILTVKSYICEQKSRIEKLEKTIELEKEDFEREKQDIIETTELEIESIEQACDQKVEIWKKAAEALKEQHIRDAYFMAEEHELTVEKIKAENKRRMAEMEALITRYENKLYG